jgi:hypothetical protein
MVRRSIPTCIILTIITFGIYGIYWFVCLTNDTNRSSGDANATSGGLAFVFTLITFGIYGIYWAYRNGERINQAKAYYGIPADTSLPLVYLLLMIFGLGIVAYALMQNDLNKIIDAGQARWQGGPVQ